MYPPCHTKSNGQKPYLRFDVDHPQRSYHCSEFPADKKEKDAWIQIIQQGLGNLSSDREKEQRKFLNDYTTKLGHAEGLFPLEEFGDVT